MPEQNLNIGIILDIICPWCFVGKRRIEKAIALAKQKWPQLTITVKYLPYQLDPSMQKGLDRQQVYHRKFGEKKFAQIKESLLQAGEEENIKLSFNGQMSNTMDAHRLVYYARDHGSGMESEDKVVEAIMHRYFECEQDIGDVEVLAKCAEEANVGLDKAKVKEYLESAEGVNEVNGLVDKLQQKLEISGVPFYILNQRFGISGAQTPEDFMAAFEKALEQI